MANEGEFPKIDGDIFYASEVNNLATPQGISQIAYEAVNISANFTNTDYLGADRFTAIAGTKNTIDTGSSTAIWGGGGEPDSNVYYSTFTDEASGDTLHDPNSFTNAANAFDGDDNTYADKSGGLPSLGRTFSAKTVSVVRVKVFFDWEVASSSSAKLETFDGSTWTTFITFSLDDGETKSVTYFNLGSIQGIRITAGTSITSMRVYFIEYGSSFDTPTTVQTNTIISDIIPNNIIVYGRSISVGSSNITVDVSQTGGSPFTITNQSLNSSIDVSAFTGSEIALNFNLIAGNGSVTPRFFGYGLNIIR